MVRFRQQPPAAPAATADLKSNSLIKPLTGKHDEYAEMQRRLQEVTLLSRVIALTASAENLNDALKQICTELAHFLRVPQAGFALLNEEQTEARVVAEYRLPGRPSGLGAVIPVANNPSMEYILARKVPLVVRNAQTSPLLAPVHELMRRHEIASILIVPIIIGNRVIGTLGLDSPVLYEFSQQNLSLVQDIASQVAQALERVRLFEAERRQLRLAQTLQQVAALLTASQSLDEIYERVFDLLAQVIKYDSVSVQLINPDGTMVLAAGRGFSSLELARIFSRKLTVGTLESRWGGKQVVVYPDTYARQEWRRDIGLLRIRSWIAAKLLVRGQLIGVLNVDSRVVNSYSHDDGQTVAAFAHQAAAAIERAQLYQALQTHADNLAEQVAHRTAELQAERDRTQAILDSAGEGIFFADKTYNLLYANPAIAHLTGYPAATMLGETPLLWLSEQTIANYAQEMKDAAGNDQGWSGEVEGKRQDGTPFDANLTLAPLGSSGDGAVTGFVGILADIGRLKEIERLKSKFVSNVSHELRTPLTNIKTYVTLLKKGRPERWEHYLQVLDHETARLTRLIQDLLDLSRLDTAAPTHLATAEANTLVTDLYHSFLPDAQAKQIGLEAAIAPGLPKIRANTGQLGQVLTNLVGNALAYTPQGGRVKITADEDALDGQRMIRFQITDNGPGLTPEDKARLFERFYRGQAARESGAPGTGLGLSISQEIVLHHRGRMEVASECNQGATFTVWIPAVESAG